MYFWLLPPFLVAIIILCIDFLAIIIIRIVIERKFYFQKWWTFKFGDSIFLPLYGYFAATIIQKAPVSLWNYPIWWHVLMLSVGYLSVLYIEYLHVRQNIIPLKKQFVPSQLYHSFMFGIMFYLITITFPVLLAAHQPYWAFILAIISFSFYLIATIRDIFWETLLKKPRSKSK